MPKVSINIIKDWFRNQQKPPQEQFWAWLDSFWHKDEPIPQSAVENLVSTLQNKADLVDGVVPEEQLPFSVVTSEIITLGAASVTGNTVNLAVHSSGENKVRVKGKLITRTFPNSWTFTELEGTGYKVLRGYAVKWEDDFFLAEGEELPDITDPEIPENALQLFKFTISASGVVLEENEEPGFKLQAEDNFKNVVIPSSTPVSILIAASPSSSFNILPNVLDPKISGIRTKSGKNSRDGHEITLYNDSAIPVTILTGAYSESSVVTTYGFAEEFIIKPHTYQKFKRRNNLYEVLGGGGGAELPPGANGQIYEIDNSLPEKIKPSDRLTTAESNILNKVDKPTIDGIWSLQKLGSVFTWVSGVVQNIANTDLSNISARIFTQGNTFTWNTAGFFYYMKGLLDKTGNATYTKVVVVHPTTGEMVTRDFADPQATTLAVQSANNTQKTAMRTALLGTAVPANPVLQDVAPRFATRGNIMVDIYGINLTLLDPTFIWIEKLDGTKIYATTFYNLTNTAFTTIWNLPLDLPNGDYAIKIQNGVTVQGLSNAVITVVDAISGIDLLATNWMKRTRLDSNGNEINFNPSINFATNNYVKISMFNLANQGYVSGDPNSIPAITFKSQNVFLGDKDWDIDIKIGQLGGHGANASTQEPFIGLTETSHANFSQIYSLVNNSYMLMGGWGMKLTPLSNTLSLNTTTGDFRLYISKVGNKLFYRLHDNTNKINFTYNQVTIDTTKNYALFFRDSYNVGNGFNMNKEMFITARIMN